MGAPIPQAITDFQIAGGDSYVDPVSISIFTVPGTEQVVINAVSMTVNYPSAGILADVYAIQYVVPGGAVQFQQWTPQFTEPGTSNDPEALYLTWAQGATGSDQLSPTPYVQLDSAPLDGFSTGTFPLPWFAVQPQTQVVLVRAHGASGGTPAVTVTDCVITYTPDSGAGSVTSGPQGIPLLTDTSTG